MKRSIPFHCLLALTTSVLLSGCYSSVGQTYSPSDGNMWHLGFSETQLANNIYRVTYNGYSIPAAQATDFALLRSSELCLKSGFTHFIVTERNGQTTNAGGMIIPMGSAAVYANVSQPEITLTVKFGEENTDYFNAAFIQQNLKKKYNIK